MPEQTYLEAIRAGLEEEMRRDPAVYIFGEDVALGGPFGVEGWPIRRQPIGQHADQRSDGRASPSERPRPASGP
jgi:hypothetical protein